jgi:hypothetical protein
MENENNEADIRVGLNPTKDFIIEFVNSDDTKYRLTINKTQITNMGEVLYNSLIESGVDCTFEENKDEN